jgi:hypothetical protein
MKKGFVLKKYKNSDSNTIRIFPLEFIIQTQYEHVNAIIKLLNLVLSMPYKQKSGTNGANPYTNKKRLKIE